jgi:hypothetical protein
VENVVTFEDRKVPSGNWCKIEGLKRAVLLAVGFCLLGFLLRPEDGKKEVHFYYVTQLTFQT